LRLLGTLLVGSIILSPSETREFAGNALASLVSAANVLFHDRTNSFCRCRPLPTAPQHRSLSLEEFPLILGVLVVRAGAAPARILAYLVALSLAWCVVVGLFRTRHVLLHADGALLGARCGSPDRLRGGAPG